MSRWHVSPAVLTLVYVYIAIICLWEPILTSVDLDESS